MRRQQLELALREQQRRPHALLPLDLQPLEAELILQQVVEALVICFRLLVALREVVLFIFEKLLSFYLQRLFMHFQDYCLLSTG